MITSRTTRTVNSPNLTTKQFNTATYNTMIISRTTRTVHSPNLTTKQFNTATYNTLSRFTHSATPSSSSTESVFFWLKITEYYNHSNNCHMLPATQKAWKVNVDLHSALSRTHLGDVQVLVSLRCDIFQGQSASVHRNNAIRYGTRSQGSYSCPCTPRIHLLTEWTIPECAFPAERE